MLLCRALVSMQLLMLCMYDVCCTGREFAFADTTTLLCHCSIAAKDRRAMETVLCKKVQRTSTECRSWSVWEYVMQLLLGYCGRSQTSRQRLLLPSLTHRLKASHTWSGSIALSALQSTIERTLVPSRSHTSSSICYLALMERRATTQSHVHTHSAENER